MNKSVLGLTIKECYIAEMASTAQLVDNTTGYYYYYYYLFI